MMKGIILSDTLVTEIPFEIIANEYHLLYNILAGKSRTDNAYINKSAYIYLFSY